MLLLLMLSVFGASSGQNADIAPPHFVHLTPGTGPKQVFYSGHATYINCEASGNPKPTVTLSWMRTTLNMTPTNVGVFHDVTEGVYQCLAENKYGKARSDYITVRHFGIPTTAFDDANRGECSRVYTVLKCLPETPLKGTTSRCSWTSMSSDVIIDDSHYIDVEGYLHLLNVGQGATYTCKANFVEHNLPKFTRNVTVTFIQSPMSDRCYTGHDVLQPEPYPWPMTSFPPNMHDWNQPQIWHQTTAETAWSHITPTEMPPQPEPWANLLKHPAYYQYGDPLILECLCIGAPGTVEPNVTWEIPGRTKSKMNTSADMYNRRLVIDQVDHDDSGRYMCACHTTRGRKYASTQIIVRAKYIWEVQPIPKTVKNGDTAVFTCDAKWSDGRFREKNIAWYINDEPISKEHCVCSIINKNELVFVNVTAPWASKNIQCNISSEGQSLYYNSYLKVNKRDEQPGQLRSDTDFKTGLIVGCVVSSLVVTICVVLVLKGRTWIRKKWQRRKAEQSMKFRLELAKYNRSSRYVKFPTHSDEFPIDRLHFLDTLGAGNFGKVMKAEALNIAGTGKWDLVAVKMCRDRATDAEKEHLYNETVIMRKIPRHINVVNYLSYVASSEPTLLIMEYVPGGDLLQFLRKRRPGRGNRDTEDSTEGSSGGDGDQQYQEDQMNLLSSRDLSYFALQIAKGMAHVATYNVIHRDLAARNVLLGLGNVCKISDFGLSRDMEHSDEYEVSSRGPLPIRWMAPESLTDGLYTLKSDVWSYGILLWELVTLGASPYSGQCARQVMASVREGRRLEKPDFCSDHVYKLMTQCWLSHPGDRPTFSDLADTIEEHLEEEAEYVQLSNFDVNVYNVIDMGDMDVAEEKV